LVRGRYAVSGENSRSHRRKVHREQWVERTQQYETEHDKQWVERTQQYETEHDKQWVERPQQYETEHDKQWVERPQQYETVNSEWNALKWNKAQKMSTDNSCAIFL